MVTKFRLIALGSALFGMIWLSSCGGQKTEEATDTETTTEEVATTETMETETTTEENKAARVSPPATANGTVGGTSVVINYSQPSVKGRTIWGDLVPYDQVWRTGANEATVFEVSNDVNIEGEMLPAGKYALFTIPSAEGLWTVIFNKTYEQWGAYDYNADDDVLRIEVSPEMVDENMEAMTFMVEEGNVVLRWEKLKLAFSVEEASGAAESTEG